MINTDCVKVKNKVWWEVRDHAWLKVWLWQEVLDQVRYSVRDRVLFKVWYD